MANYEQIISRLEYAIFGSPERALGFGGWSKRHDKMQTRLRPDGSDGGRADKTVLKFLNDSLFLTYNGSSFSSGYVTRILKDKYGTGWMKTVCKMYGISREDFTVTDNEYQDYHKQTTAKPKPYTIGDESAVEGIPQKLVSLTYDRTRPDVLRQYLCSVFGETATLQAWERYRVGDGYGGQTLFWCYDKSGKCRCGKNMCYRPDGHRDKEHTISIGWELQKNGKIPADTKLRSCLFGEHLLSKYPLAPVGLVESEKTAIVCSIVSPGAVWLATGGATQNLDRAIALLHGRKVTVFPDADATSDWKNRFGFGKVRGFSVDEICRDYCRKNGEKWRKCDIADIIIEEYRQRAISL